MKTIFKNTIMLLLIAVGMSVQAQEKPNKNAKQSFEVNGNCDICKKRIEKAAYSVSGVKSASWDIESHQLSLILNEEKTSVMSVKEAVAKVGHDTDDVKSDDTTYSNLHGCCQYVRIP